MRKDGEEQKTEKDKIPQNKNGIGSETEEFNGTDGKATVDFNAGEDYEEENYYL